MIKTTFPIASSEKKRLSTYLEHIVTLGNQYRRKGQLNQAKRNYCQALEIDQNFKLAWLNLGALLANENIYDEEIERYMTRLGEPYGSYRITKGILQETVTMSAQEIQQASKEDKAFPEAFFLGEMLLSLTQYELAHDCWATILMEYPSSLDAWMNFGICKTQLHYRQEAKEIFEKKILKKQPFQLNANHNLSILFREEKNFPLWVKHQLLDIQIGQNRDKTKCLRSWGEKKDTNQLRLWKGDSFSSKFITKNKILCLQNV